MPLKELLGYQFIYISAFIVWRILIVLLIFYFPFVPASGSGVSGITILLSCSTTLYFYVRRESSPPLGREYWIMVSISAAISFILDLIVFFSVMHYQSIPFSADYAILMVFLITAALSLFGNMIGYSDFVARRWLR
ncbi:hypothetical protein [Jiella avicenniae]|uniref:Uncharacterized protein n=1 Tax=Jiella avicenniae TaxID=2907202 RepID=A0A9X1T7R3_9HYPH|nr:hypothetical protein [Jiella avicenniae]MCE7030730.1 hypothetical protein [Jiella avicenniae]